MKALELIRELTELIEKYGNAEIELSLLGNTSELILPIMGIDMGNKCENSIVLTWSLDNGNYVQNPKQFIKDIKKIDDWKVL